jgi:lysophospholipase L1-like esterase
MTRFASHGSISRSFAKALLPLALLAVLGSCFVLEDEELKTTVKYWIYDAFQGNTRRNLMLGSSSIARLDAEKYVSECGAWLNRGIGNSTISGLRRYLRYSPLSIAPFNILLYTGENDISRGLSVDNTIRQYKDLLQYLLDSYPKSRLHVIALKPSPARKAFWAEFSATNQAIAKFLAGTPQAFFHEPVWPPFAENNPAAFLPDGIHLTDRGYDIFVTQVRKACKSN